MISGNAQNGVDITDAATGNQIFANRIGTNVGGTAEIPNKIGIAFGNTVDGTPGRRPHGRHRWAAPATGVCNVISGSDDQGIVLFNGATNTIIEGNYIGTDVTGTATIPNRFGIHVGTTITGARIGGLSIPAGNLISGNDQSGIFLDGHRQRRCSATSSGRTSPAPTARPNTHRYRHHRPRQHRREQPPARQPDLRQHDIGITASARNDDGTQIVGNKIGTDTGWDRPGPERGPASSSRRLQQHPDRRHDRASRSGGPARRLQRDLRQHHLRYRHQRPSRGTSSRATTSARPHRHAGAAPTGPGIDVAAGVHRRADRRQDHVGRRQRDLRQPRSVLSFGGAVKVPEPHRHDVDGRGAILTASGITVIGSPRSRSARQRRRQPDRPATHQHRRHSSRPRPTAPDLREYDRHRPRRDRCVRQRHRRPGPRSQRHPDRRHARGSTSCANTVVGCNVITAIHISTTLRLLRSCGTVIQGNYLGTDRQRDRPIGGAGTGHQDRRRLRQHDHRRGDGRSAQRHRQPRRPSASTPQRRSDQPTIAGQLRRPRLGQHHRPDRTPAASTSTRDGAQSAARRPSGNAIVGNRPRRPSGRILSACRRPSGLRATRSGDRDRLRQRQRRHRDRQISRRRVR